MMQRVMYGKKSVLFVVGVLFVGALLVCGLTGCGSSGSGAGANGSSGQPAGSQKQAAVTEDSVAPDFEFTIIDGEKARLSDYRGKVVLLNFWATWCGYCVKEMPDMQRIAKDYPDVVILTVARNDDSSKATKFAREKGYDFIWALDEDGSISALYPVDGIPYSLIINKEGKVGAISEGVGPDMYSYYKKALVAAGA